MELIQSTLTVGLERPLKVLHVTDSHIALADARDNERKHSLAKRLGAPEKERYFREHLAYAKAHCDLMVHTGDLIDFTSQANFDFARSVLAEEKVFFIAGNHEFSQYVGEAYEDRAYKMNSFREMLPEGLGVPLFFNSRVVGGVNFVAIDDSYHQFESWQITRLKKEIAKGLPIILCLHVPLFERSLYNYHVERSGPGTSCYLAGCEEDDLPVDEWRAIEIRPRGVTMEAIDFIKSQPQIKAVLAGHVHFSFESCLAPGMPQFVTGGGYDGIARELTIL
ncbi:MAG: metallophosphoesterase [Clostridia bacterium]|nr:metallophosphoesterase [Clostridia bacterium]